jgi:hypothetical protein
MRALAAFRSPAKSAYRFVNKKYSILEIGRCSEDGH